MGPTPHAPAVQAQQQGAQKMNLMQMLSQPTVPTPVPAAPAANLFGGPTPTPSYGGMSMMSPMAPAAPSMGGVRTPMSGGAPLGGAAVRPAPAPAAKSSGGGFEDLWTMSLGSAKPSTPVGGTGAGKSMQALQKEKTQAALFGSGMGAPASSGSFGGMGGFGNAPAKPSGGAPSSSDADDLLL
jgi:epsin